MENWHWIATNVAPCWDGLESKWQRGIGHTCTYSPQYGSVTLRDGGQGIGVRPRKRRHTLLNFAASTPYILTRGAMTRARVDGRARRMGVLHSQRTRLPFQRTLLPRRAGEADGRELGSARSHEAEDSEAGGGVRLRMQGNRGTTSPPRELHIFHVAGSWCPSSSSSLWPTHPLPFFLVANSD